MNLKEILAKEIENKRTEFKTENYPMSIGELVNLYANKEVLINPDFQRYFRWTDLQKTRLIESIVLGIPIPSIFVFQREDGIWEIVDGLQRVSTILQFMGELEDKPALELQGTKYLPHFEGLKWDNEGNTDLEIPTSTKLFFKRAKLNVSIILSDSGPNAKFEVFQRLNTGGSYASDQEVRNSVMIMVNKATFEWFSKLSEFDNYLNTISISDRLFDEQYHIELALRHIALVYYEYSPKKDIKDYFDDVVEQILLDDDFDYLTIGEKFKSTFNVINELFGENAFKRYDGTKFKGKFLESAYEAVSVGLALNFEKYNFPKDNDIFVEKVQKLHGEEYFLKYTGSGSNARTRIPKLMPFIKDFFSK